MAVFANFAGFAKSVCFLGTTGPVLLLIASCAKVGDPVPPEARPVEPITELSVVQRGTDGVLLEFTLPPIAREVEILRGCDAESLQLLLSVQADDLEQAESLPGRRRLQLSSQPDQPCRYSARVRDRRSGRSAPVPPIEVTWQPPPPCPRNPMAEVHPDHILVRWDPPESEAGLVVAYLVNVRHLVFGTNFRIEDFTFGVPLNLVVDAVAHVGNPTVSSADCTTISLVPRDVFPPAVPTGLRAIRLPVGVQLLWDPVADADLEGYRIYRRDPGGEKVIAAEMAPTNQFIDRNAPSDRLVYYEVTAVDRDGNESAPSVEAEAPPDRR